MLGYVNRSTSVLVVVGHLVLSTLRLSFGVFWVLVINFIPFFIKCPASLSSLWLGLLTWSSTCMVKILIVMVSGWFIIFVFCFAYIKWFCVSVLLCVLCRAGPCIVYRMVSHAIALCSVGMCVCILRYQVGVGSAEVGLPICFLFIEKVKKQDWCMCTVVLYVYGTIASRGMPARCLPVFHTRLACCLAGYGLCPVPWLVSCPSPRWPTDVGTPF